jgi:hypothetical protein
MQVRKRQWRMPLGSPVGSSPPAVALRPRICDAFAEERRVVVGNGGGRWRTPKPHAPAVPSTSGRVLVAPRAFCRRTLAAASGVLFPHIARGRWLGLPSFDPVREAGARTDDAFSPARSSPPFVALRPYVAARWSMSGASCRRRRRPSADAKRSSSLLGQSPIRRTSVGRTAANGSRFLPVDPVRQAGAGDCLFAPGAHRHLPSRCARAFRRVRR